MVGTSLETCVVGAQNMAAQVPAESSYGLVVAAQRSNAIQHALVELALVDDVIGLVCQYARQLQVVLVDRSKPSVDYVYDPSTDKWNTELALPAVDPRASLGLVLDKLLRVLPRQLSAGHVVFCTAGISTLPTLFQRPDVVWTFHGQLYVMGDKGMNGDLYFMSFDPKTREWRGRAKPEHRYWHAAAVLGDCLYSIGGVITNTVERYDPVKRAWSKCGPLSHPRWNASAAASGNAIYVCGGICRQGGRLACLSSCEAYDPRSDRWNTIASMGCARRFPTSVCIDGHVVVCGGMWCLDGHSCDTHVPWRQSVEQYNLESNTWSLVAHMPVSPTQPFAIVV
jgi:hypothetical protein